MSGVNQMQKRMHGTKPARTFHKRNCFSDSVVLISVIRKQHVTCGVCVNRLVLYDVLTSIVKLSERLDLSLDW